MGLSLLIITNKHVDLHVQEAGGGLALQQSSSASVWAGTLTAGSPFSPQTTRWVLAAAAAAPALESRRHSRCDRRAGGGECRLSALGCRWLCPTRRPFRSRHPRHETAAAARHGAVDEPVGSVRSELAALEQGLVATPGLPSRRLRRRQCWPVRYIAVPTL